MNSTLALIRAQKAMTAAEADAKAARKQSEDERKAAAFSPLLAIWNDVKHLPSSHWRWHSSSRETIPLEKHAMTVGASFLTFTAGDGNSGLRIAADLAPDGSVIFETSHDYRNIKRITFDEARDLLVKHLTSVIILPDAADPAPPASTAAPAMPQPAGQQGKLETFVAGDTSQARNIAALLIQSSCWFTVTPLPDDRFEIATKPEGHLLRAGVPSGSITTRTA